MKFYQHVMVYGGPGHYVVRLEEGGEEKVFTTYNEALLCVIRHLSEGMAEGHALPVSG